MCHLTNQIKPLMKWMKSHWSMLARVGFSILLVGIVVKNLDWEGTKSAALNLKWSWWLVGLGIFFVLHTLCSIRWYLLLHPLDQATKMVRCWLLYFEGMFFSLCLPSTIGGDVIKAFRISPIKSGRVLAMCSMIADRLSGLIAVLIIGLSAMAMKKWELESWQAIAIGCGMFAASCVATWIGLASIGFLNKRLADGSKIKKSLSLLDEYHSRPILVCRAIALSIVIQLLNAVSVYFLGLALGITLPLSVYFIVVPIAALLVTVPVSVGGIGVRETIMVTLLAEYGIAKEPSVLLSITWFSLNIVAGLLGVVFYMSSSAPKVNQNEVEDYANAMSTDESDKTQSTDAPNIHFENQKLNHREMQTN